ncbi:MAG: metallophosphoesterase family protein [Candidatus Zophobacter franzmannii]|nr:metallophosphoesterase family protein [Candidatus Zophobacter franzmannii]
MSKSNIRKIYDQLLEGKQLNKILKLIIRHIYFVIIYIVVKRLARITGLNKIGHRNSLDLQKKEATLYSPTLAKEHDGIRLLYFSDMHLDNNPELQPILAKMLDTIDYDICICGGDFKADEHPDYTELEGMFGKVFEGLDREKPTFAVAGNHDNNKTITLLEDRFTFLDNASAKLEINGKVLELVGVDDCHFFHADDIEEAYKDVDRDNFTVFLSHSPEMYKKAEKYDADLFLAGHTHGGQICLPGGFALSGNSGMNRKIIKGLWSQGKMKGFTSAGVGTSLVPIRFNCPPEVVVITLKHGYGENKCR